VRESIPPAPDDEAGERLTLERFVGGKLFAVVGALVVIAGAGFGLKLAWDLGWFGLLSDAGKSAAMGGFGAALLVAGELARRRWGRAAGEGLCAAGLGVLFATVYAMTARFELTGWTTGVVALLSVAIVGFGLAARTGLVVTPAVAVLGAFVTPLLLGEPERGLDGILPVYWLTLVGLAHALTAFVGVNYVPARRVAWWGGLVIGGHWALHTASDGDALWSAGYVAGVWLMTHGELWRICARNEGAWGRGSLERSITAGVGTTLWGLILGFVLAHTKDWDAWTVPAVFGAANLLLALRVIGVRGLLRDPRETREVLGATLAFTGGMLGVLAALMRLEGWMEPLALVCVGFACMVAATRARASWTLAYGFVVLSIGTLTALGASGLREGASATVGGLELTRWSVVVAIAGLAWLATALVRRDREESSAGYSGPALALFGVALVSDAPDLRWLSAGWGVMAFAFVLAHRAMPRLRLAEVGLGGLCVSAGAWAAAYVPGGWSGGAVLGEGALSVHVGLIAGVATSAALLVAARVVRAGRERDGFEHVLALTGVCIAGVMTLAATTLDVARIAEVVTQGLTVRCAAVSIWWGVFALGLLGLGAQRKSVALRGCGLALMSVATLKAVFFDLVAVPAGWRVASFLLLGLLLLGVATAYARSSVRKTASSDAER